MIRRIALFSLAVAAAASVANAQCFTATGSSIAGSLVPTSIYPVDDEGLSPDTPFVGFTFPIRGTAWTHFAVSSNGEVYLTDGTGVVGLANFGIDTTSEMWGAAGDSPRVCAFGDDLQGIAGLVGWDILVDDTVANQVKITWTGMRHYSGSDDFAMSVTLHSTGAVDLSYNNGNFGSPSGFDFAGVAAGNAVGAGSSSSTLSAGGDTGTTELVFQNTWGWDLASKTVSVLPNGTSGFTYGVSCAPSNPPAVHTAFGQGCYNLSSFAAAYHQYTDAASLQAALQGTAMSFTPNGVGYTLAASAAPFVAPVAPTTLVLGDDQQVAITPSAAFNYLGTTPIASLYVCSNGFVSVGGGNSVFAYGSTGAFNGSVDGKFSSNMDLDPSAGGSGQVVWEEVGGVVYVTFDNVYRWSTTDAERFQFQCDLASGTVVMAWDTLSGSAFAPTCVGYTPGGSVLNNPIDFTTQLPFATATDFSFPAMSLAASPAPISTAGSGTVVTYTASNVPDANVNTGIRLGVVVISLGGNLGGLDLTGIGAPGCSLYVNSLDLTLTIVDVANNSTLTTAFGIPAGVTPTTLLYAQAAALIVPGSLPNGQNAFGATFSNGVESFISDN